MIHIGIHGEGVRNLHKTPFFFSGLDDGFVEAILSTLEPVE